jgi:DDE superfamily endonuclease
MTEQRRTRTFENFPFALYATDVKFQVSNRPSGKFMEQKHYFSGKHKLYGCKIECSVSPSCQVVHLSSHYPGSASDLRIFEEGIESHRQMLSKTAAEKAEPDYGEGADVFRDFWAVLCDKGYQGAGAMTPTLQPKKQPRGGSLTYQEGQFNIRVSSD